MNAGILRHRIDIQEKVITRDDEGGESVTWVDWALSVPAKIAPLSGKEFLSASTELGQVSTRITIRFRDGVKPTMRARHKATIYNILAVLPDAESGRTHENLICSDGTNEG